MKANMINSNSVIKSICAVVILLGMSVSAWGEKTGTLSMNSSVSSGTINNGVTFTWSSANIAVNTTNNGFKANSNMTITIPSGKMLTGISKVNGSAWGSGAKISVYAGSNSSGTKLTDIVTGTNSYTISSNNTGTTYYFENSTDKNAWINSLSITYANASACYVVYDPAGGSCAAEDDTEEGPGEGVILPAATPSVSMASMGWGFYGWAEDAVDDPTTTTPTIVGKAGDTYYPDEDVILTAVYAKGEYTKITSTSDLNSTSKYIFAAVYSSKNYVMTSKYASQKLAAEQIDETSSGKYAAALMNASWCFTLEANSTYWHIKDCNSANTDHYLDTYYTEWYGHAKDNADPYTFTWSTDHWTIQNKYTSGNRYFGYSNSDEAFKTYSAAQELQIYKETKTPTYCSDPSTVKLVASPAAGGTVVFDSNSKAEMDFNSDDGLDDVGITATPNSGYEFVNWVSSNNTNASIDDDDDATTNVTAIGSATITANFYKMSSVTLTLTGLTKTSGPNGANAITSSVDAADIVWVFSVNDHYRTTPLTCSVTMGGSTLTEGVGNDYTWNASTKTLTIPAATDITGDLVITISAEHTEYTKYAFSCAELTLTPKLVTAGTPIFITSAASKTVRSQDSILIVGSGLTPNTTLTYPGLPSKFAIKTRLGANLQTDVNGEINAVAYIFYTPDAGDETDGLDKLTGITVSVGGAKPITKTLTQNIIGRHLPADFVIAAKRDGKWYALPDTMTGTWNPKPVEIAVDDIDNPTIAYTATTNVYNLYGQVSETIGGQAGYLYSNGHTIKLGMKNNATYANYPLFGSAGTSTIGKGGIATSVTNNIGKQYWWVLTQTNTSIENAQDAKYSIKSANNTAPLILKENAGNPQWGFFTTGSVGPIRLIPASASSVVPLEAKIVAWGKDSAIIEADVPTIIAHYVKGKLPGDIESEKITLSQTGTSVKGTGTRFNYTVGFGASMDFSANEGKMLTLEWYDVLDNLVAVSNVTVPKIVASDITISKANYTNKSVWNTEVHVMPGKAVTIDASAYDGSNVTIKELNIYPGATVTVTGGTLIPTTLVLRNGWSRIGEKKYDIARLHIASTGSVGSTTAYADWYIDYDQYYPIAVPWNVTTANISYQNMTVATSAGLIVRHYDGERHAKGGDGNTNWKAYAWGGDMPATLTPGIGYAITARRPAGKAFSIIRMPLTIPSAAWTTNGEQGVVSETHKDQVEVIAWVKEEGETPKHAKGWNFIANPYMCNYKGDITHSESDGEHDYDIGYVNIPDVNFKEFDQVATDKAKLKPGSGFLIQTEETGTLTFGTSNRKASAPSYRTATPKASKQKAYITLSGEDAEDEMGLIISERYTAEYEINADLEKLLSDGNTLRTFMRYGELNMAYVAINEELAREWIPVTVRIPAAGEYTFSLHEASKISELEGIYLIDYESNTVTNLIEDNYSFVAAGGTIADRFAINAIVGKHNTPTDIDIINAGGDINSKKPVKFIWDDKVFILHNGVIYDSTGKRVREINR